ncbi:hypothetical protein [Martelella soudanensis]|uniref:hypothetical protein n=1 Tax=unclassified Martelella TaxID=2629616 RepID=UPI0015DE1542|nr:MULTISPECIES: hypothetical protein [unclassified Martelella]
MHTIFIILGGLVSMALIYGIALWLNASLRRAFLIFVIVWAVAASVNLWIGVAHAGYSVAAELPIFAVVFGVPCLIGWFISWRLS